MKRISYAGGSFVTGDGIADALLDYAAVLARAGSADRLSVPAIGGEEGVVSIDLVVGPASQLIAAPEEHLGSELLDDGFVSEAHRRGRLVRAGRSDQIENPGGV